MRSQRRRYESDERLAARLTFSVGLRRSGSRADALSTADRSHCSAHRAASPAKPALVLRAACGRAGWFDRQRHAPSEGSVGCALRRRRLAGLSLCAAEGVVGAEAAGAGGVSAAGAAVALAWISDGEDGLAGFAGAELEALEDFCGDL